MARFRFRLQKLLDHRLRQEEAAKEGYLIARSRRIDAEEELVQMEKRRRDLFTTPVSSLGEMMGVQAAASRMEAEEAQHKIAIAVLVTEEEVSQEQWLAARRDAEAIGKLRTRDLEVFQKEEAKREQAELDEWAVTRRAA